MAPAFVAQEPFFAVQAAGIASECVVAADDAMARQYDGYWIKPIGAADSTAGIGLTEARSQGTVAGRRPWGNSAQCQPYSLLEWRTARINYHIVKGVEVTGEVCLHAGDHGQWIGMGIELVGGTRIAAGQQLVHAVGIIDVVEDEQGMGVAGDEDIADG